MSTLSITELGAIAHMEVACAEMVATTCGAWVSDPQPSTRRGLWADISQSYTWYAESWQARLPVLPDDLLASITASPEAAAHLDRTRLLLADATDDAARLRVLTTAIIPSTLGRLEDLTPRIDARLDTPTRILIDRVQLDLNRLLYAASQS